MQDLLCIKLTTIYTVNLSISLERQTLLLNQCLSAYHTLSLSIELYLRQSKSTPKVQFGGLTYDFWRKEYLHRSSWHHWKRRNLIRDAFCCVLISCTICEEKVQDIDNPHQLKKVPYFEICMYPQ